MRRPIAIVTMKVLLFALIVLTTTQLTAQKVSTSPAPGWLVKYTPDLSKKPNSKNIHDGFYLLVLEQQNNAEVNTVYHHYVRQIISEAGIQNASEISVDYDPQYEKLVFHQITIHRNGESINKLPSAVFKQLQKEQDLSRFIYSGTYTAYHILEDVRKGDQIEYAYSIIGDNPIFAGKAERRFYLEAYEPIVNYYRNLIIDTSRNVRFKIFNNAIEPTKRIEKRNAIYEWNKILVRESESYSNQPSWYNPYNYIQISEYSSWKEVAQWAIKVNKIPTPGPLLQQKINTFKQAAKGDSARYLLTALRFVQDDIRYMGIEMGEYSHRANSPEKVLAQRFGDCKDKALLLCTMLKNYGIDADLAYVNTELKGKISDFLPSPNAFNHVIVRATLNGKSYWLDGTASFQRGTLNELCEPDFQQTLIASDTTTQLSAIPIKTKGSTNITETFTLPDNQYKEGTLKVVTDYNLDDADRLRDELANSSMESKDESYLNYYRKLYGDVAIKDSLQATDPLPGRNTIRVKEDYILNTPWKRDSTSGKLLFTVTAQSFYDALSIISNTQRNAPVSLRYPYVLDYKIIINTPIEWTIEDAPEHISNSYYNFDYTIENNSKQITLNIHFETLSDHVPVDFLPQYLQDLKKMIAISSLDLTWNPILAPSNTHGRKINWLTLTLAFIFIGIFTWIAKRYYRHSIFPENEASEPVHIGGGLALLAIGLVFSPLLEVSMFFKLPAFSYDRWIGINALSDNINITALQLFLVMEMMIKSLLLVGSILLAVLFFNRRDTFPITLATYYFIDILFIFMDQNISNHLFKQEAGKLADYMLLIPLIKMAIWIPYIRMSERGKATFIIPYTRSADVG